MAEGVKAGQVDIEDVMRAVRESIAEKKARGLYTDAEMERIAGHRLHPVLDANEFRSRLLQELLGEPGRWNYTFDPEAIYRSSRGAMGRLLERSRRWLRPLQKLFWNPVPMISALSRQSDLNEVLVHVLHNLAEQATRLNLDNQDLRNRVLQLQGQLALQARRQKVLEELLVPGEKGAQPEPPKPGVLPPPPDETR
jgi:hypothetical protein